MPIKKKTDQKYARAAWFAIECPRRQGGARLGGARPCRWARDKARPRHRDVAGDRLIREI